MVSLSFPLFLFFSFSFISQKICYKSSHPPPPETQKSSTPVSQLPGAGEGNPAQRRGGGRRGGPAGAGAVRGAARSPGGGRAATTIKEEAAELEPGRRGALS